MKWRGKLTGFFVAGLGVVLPPALQPNAPDTEKGFPEEISDLNCVEWVVGVIIIVLQGAHHCQLDLKVQQAYPILTNHTHNRTATREALRSGKSGLRKPVGR